MEMNSLYRIAVAFTCLCIFTDITAQTNAAERIEGEVVVIEAINFTVSEPLVEIGTPVVSHERPKVIKNKLRRQKYVNEDAIPLGDDPVWQKDHGTRVSRAVDANFDGISGGNSIPPDPSGAIGPNHYVQMTNSGYEVFDREGNSLYGPVSIASLWPGSQDAGDPIVMYDKYADRWFLSQFQYGNTGILVAISTTPDPLGTYYTYEFPWNSFPDYPKYSIWHDGYYMTANCDGQDAAAFERDKMLVGDPSAQLVQLTIPNFNAPGFKAPLPADADGVLPPTGTPMMIFYFRDDGWSGVSDDVIQVWSMEVDWNNPNSSTIEEIYNLTTAPFDSEFNTNWDDVQQPGTSQRLDAIPGALMYRAQYRQFANHNSIIINHAVDVNGSNQAGVRWYEIRQTPNIMYIHQQGSFAPDEESRFMASAAMDYQGNIALAYSISGPTVYPGLRYTGRMAADALNEMTLEEEVIIDGGYFQSWTNRYGDYSQLTMDPLDDATFWFTGEYLDYDGEWRTRICSFKIANDFAINIGPTDVVSPASGALTASESITINVTNFGLEDQSSFPVSYRINGGAWVDDTFIGTIGPGNTEAFTFAAAADFSSQGDYSVEVKTALSTDMYEADDLYLEIITHLFSFDTGVVSIDSPESGMGLTDAEQVSTTVTNYGAMSLANIPVSYSINGGTVVEETLIGPLLPGESVIYMFATSADLSIPGSYEFYASTGLNYDQNPLNNSTTEIIIHDECLAVADCTWGDGFEYVGLNTIDNGSGCGTAGYSDFSSISTDLEAGGEYDLIITSGYDEQSMTVWIDYDDSGTFEDDEMHITNILFDYDVTTQINIPLAAPLGPHILRLKACFDEDSDAVCQDCTYGETEDYTVNITAHISVPEVDFTELFVTVDGNSLQIHIEGLNESISLTLLNSLGQTLFESSLSPSSGSVESVDMKHYARGHYLVKLEGGTGSRSLVKVVY